MCVFVCVCMLYVRDIDALYVWQGSEQINVCMNMKKVVTGIKGFACYRIIQ